MASFQEEYNQWSILIRGKIKEVDKYRNKNQKLQKIRAIYLLLNRTRYKMCSFQPKMLKFWRTTTYKKEYLLDQVRSYINDNNINCDIKKVNLLITTLNKFENPCMKIIIILNKIFCYDLAREISTYI
jgi:acyl-ACP thioesterase